MGRASNTLDVDSIEFSFFSFDVKSEGWTMGRFSGKQLLVLLVIISTIVLCYRSYQRRIGPSTVQNPNGVLQSSQSVEGRLFMDSGESVGEAQVRSKETHTIIKPKKLKKALLDAASMVVLATRAKEVAPLPTLPRAHHVEAATTEQIEVHARRTRPILATTKPAPAKLVEPASKTGGAQSAAKPSAKGNEDTEKLQFVKKMIKHAWDSYEKHAWGYNELSATGKSGSDGQGMFGNSHIGASLVDALDTLYIAGFMDEYKRGRKWVKEHLDYNKVVGSTVSMFEMNIRFVGACLSMYALTGDQLYKEKAKDLVDRFMPAFRSSGLAHNWIVLNGYSKARDDSGPCFVIAEPGTLHLEFAYLSTITGDNRYLKQVEKVRDALTSSSMSGSLPGLISSEINTDSGTPCKSELSLDGGSDSYYEYLIKSYLQSGKTDARALRLFNDLVKSVDSKMMGKVTKGGKTYRFLGRTSGGGGYLDTRMGHLACFSGGMFALGAKHSSQQDMSMRLGEDITEACRQMYHNTATKIGADEVSFRQGNVDQGPLFSLSSQVYLLRPEVVESYFVLWRTTKDPKYRQWAWEAAQAIEKYCRVDGGYTDLANVDQVPPHPNSGMQQSFFLAETLKYLYLIFTDDDVLPLDKWVFNTEAHPFPIKGAFDSDSNLPLHSKTA
ncbi:LOW QUALITY PROTEIN: mannosyl-oligosaccharide 1,2-alpha-mannosidase IA-like [Sycon ciliatum]|uniref:LOW QUALITY PROTEIN: mannosyl-oligosaccharide 1,2-alpha-mannosidase IA-like n=1 Tax=Sycon ciliatum TaxID=27933 RepID=UPI0031F70E10